MSKVTSFVIVGVLFVIGVLYCQGCMEVKIQSRTMVTAFTPFDKYGNLKLSVIKELIKFYKEQKITGLLLTAYYGGGPSLSLKEREAVVSAWANQGFDLFVEIGAMSFVDVLEFAKFCSTKNVTALTVFSEIVYQPEDASELVEDLNRICCASSNTPLFTHELSVVDQELGPVRSTLAATKQVSCLAGALASLDPYFKYRSSTALECYSNVSDNCQFITDTTEFIAAALILQLFAATSPAANVYPGLCLAIEKAVAEGNILLALKLQQQLNKCVAAAVNVKNCEYIDDTSRTFFENMKTAMFIKWGIDTGVRYPLETPNSTVTRDIRSNMERLGCDCY